MFHSVKENKPFSGSYVFILRRYMQRNRAVTVLAGLFVLFTLYYFFNSSPKSVTRIPEVKTLRDNVGGLAAVANRSSDPEDLGGFNLNNIQKQIAEEREQDELKRQNEEMKKELEEKEEELRWRELELESAQKKLAEAQKKMDTKEENIKDFEDNLISKQQQLKDLEEQLKNKLKDLKESPADTPKNEIIASKETPAPVENTPPKTAARDESSAEPTSGVADVDKQQAVKEAFLFAWKGYEARAWGTDELNPVSGKSHHWLGLGLTIIDSLDTLWIMDLKDEFKKARDWVAESYSWKNSKGSISFFETTIRILGGLLSAYELSGDDMFLQHADQIGEKFLPAFETPTGIPYCTINLHEGTASNPSWTNGASILSEVGTVQLEFVYLAKATGKTIYKDKALKVYQQLDQMTKPNGLYSVYVNPRTGNFQQDHVTLGALGDSFYEYLLKIWIMTGKSNSNFRRMYDEAVGAVVDQLVIKSKPHELTYIAEKIGGNLNHKMDHLVCFAGAMFALGAHGSTEKEHFAIGEEITKTCNEMYVRTETGIAAELVHFGGDNDFYIPNNAKHYLLRPETAESYFVLWRLTHNPIYREWGWKAFKAINTYCKVAYGYSGIRDVNNIHPDYDDLQQSFFLAETLKYFYLLFSDDSLIPLDKYVFNTEAHPLGIFGKTRHT